MYHKWKLYDVWFQRYGVWQTESFFSFWTIFCPFTSLITQKTKILKKWKKKKKHLEISSFYIRMPKIMIICYTFPAIWHITDVIIFHFGLFFCPFTPLTAQKIKIFKKMKKTIEDIIILQMCTKNYDHMMYGSWNMVPEMGWMDRLTEGGTGKKKWHVEVGAPPKNISKFVVNSATISNLFLMELRFKWSAMKVLKCSRRFVLILCRSFSKILEDSEMSEDFVVK